MYCVSLLSSCITTMCVILYVCIVYTAPPVPVGQTVECIHAVIVWKEVESNDEENPITNYIVDIPSSNKAVPLPPGSVYYNMTGLSPGSTYTVKVAAKNGMGVGRNATFTVVTKRELTRGTLSCVCDILYLISFQLLISVW